MSRPASVVAQVPTIDEVAAAVGQVPALSMHVRLVMDACDGADGSAQDVAQMVLADQGLTANILKLANSAHYGHPRRVTTVTDAVVLMGLSAVRSLAISSHTSRLLSRPLPGYAMASGDLWDHSLAVAFVSRRIAVAAATMPAEEAFVAGLLHDVGKVVLSDFLRDAFVELTRTAHEQRIPLHVAERELLGFDHAELGARIAADWRFPDRLVEAIGAHHRPWDATVSPGLAQCVCVADALCLMIAAGVDSDDLLVGLDPEALRVIGIGPERLRELAREVEPALADDLTME